MAYIIERFGDAWASATVLPTLDGRQPLGIRGIEGSILRLPGGRAYDWRGSERAPIAPEEIVIEGVWVADSVAAMETKHAALLALVGRRSKLWRSNGTTQHWRTARLLSIDAPIEAGFAHWMAYTMRFELAAMPWQGTARAPTQTLAVADPSYTTITCTNGGNARVCDVVVAVTAQSSAITRVRVAVPGVSDFEWTGSLAAGSTLALDCGAKRVRIGSVNAYAITLRAEHSVSDWLRLEPGDTAVRVYRSGGGATSTASISYSDGWL